MNYLSFDRSEGAEGVTTLEAMASTAAAQHTAVMAEVQQVMDWAWRHFPDSHGPLDDGGDWDHELQSTLEDGHWRTVTLTLTGTARFIDAFLEAFDSPAG